MSAIFGMIDLNQKKIDSKISERFRKEYASYQIDRLEDAFIPNAYFGCGIQYFRNIAANEKLPIIDEKNKLFFTADCFLDNRDEMLAKLSLPQGTPDGNIIYEAFLKWRTQCVDFLRGIFAFVVYDWEKNEIYFFTDHFGGRNVYICKRDNIVYFSSLLFPLVKASQLKFEENERWLADCVEDASPLMMNETRETAIKDIYKVEAAKYTLISKDKFEYTQYWFPNKIKVNQRITDKECEQQLKSILTESVANMINIDYNIAVSLSSGLDSSTAGCIAAPILKRQGKSLYCYTSVPTSKSNLKSTGYYIYDETEGVKKICEAHENMIPHFITCDNKNIFIEGKNLVNSWGLPTKSRQNAVWINEIEQAAVNDGCKIILTGGSGNTTVSAGNIDEYLWDSIRKFKFIKAYKNMNTFSQKYKMSRKHIIKYIINAQKEDFIKIFNKKSRAMLNGYLNEKMEQKYHVSKRLQKILYNSKSIASFKDIRSYIFFPRFYAQTHEIETNTSLTVGILDRDPFQNVDFIEFCMKLPLRCFVNEHFERRLVREFMKDIVPEEIRLNVKHRGKQSGDEAYLVKSYFLNNFQNVRKELCTEKLFKYVNKQKVLCLLDKIEQNINNAKDTDLHLLSNLYTFNIFLQKISEIN